MFKLAGKVIDAYDDLEFLNDPRVTLLQERGMPSASDIRELPDDCFALKVADARGRQRYFPINNALSTQISLDYFDKVAEELPESFREVAGANLRRAAEEFGLDTEKLATYSGESVEVLLADTEYRGLRTDDAELQKEADETAWRNRFNDMTPRMRSEFATKIAEKYEDVDDFIWDYAKKETPGIYFEDSLSDRREMLKHAGRTICLDTWCRTNLDLNNFDTFPEKLAMFDKAAGLDDRYVDGLLDPYVTCYGGHAKPQHKDTWEELLDKVAEADYPQYIEQLEGLYPRTSDRFSDMYESLRNDTAIRKVAELPEPLAKAIRTYFDVKKV